MTAAPGPPALLRADDPGPVLALLEAGLVVGVPTDTVYGLAARLQPEAVDRLFSAKGRPDDLAVPVLVGGHEQVGRVARSFPPPARRLAEHFWPGPLTLVVPARRPVGVLIGGPGSTVGIRWPDHPLVEELCLAAGPLAVTSANRHREPPCTSGSEVCARFRIDAVAAAIDGRTGERPSTVVDCTGRRGPRPLREGMIAWADIEAALEG